MLAAFKGRKGTNTATAPERRTNMKNDKNDKSETSEFDLDFFDWSMTPRPIRETQEQIERRLCRPIALAIESRE